MQWIFEKIMERLVVKLITALGVEWDARAEMHLSDTRAELLRRAEQLEAEETLGLKDLAASLRTQAMALGSNGECPGSEALTITRSLKDENLNEPEDMWLSGASGFEIGADGGGQLLAPEKKKKGRPRKKKTQADENVAGA